MPALRLRSALHGFAATGGLHAAAYAGQDLEVEVERGPHPVDNGVVWVSGRAGAEIVQKTARALTSGAGRGRRLRGTGKDCDVKQGRLTVWLAVVAVLAGESAMLAGPARAQDDELSTSALAFFDRVEFAGGWTRERYELQTGDELGRLATYGARFERMVSPILTFGLNVGRVERTGSRLPAPEDGTTGSLYARVDDDDIGYGAGFNFDRAPGFPVMSGFARVGPEYDLHISASYANGLPTFSSDDVDVGMGAPVGDDGALWLGASTPFCRDVVSFKAVGRYRLAEAFEVTASGRFGNSRAGRVDGFSLGVAYVAPERSVHVPGKGTWLAGLLAPQSGRLHYLGAGAVAGAIGGVMAAGVAAQRPCGEASFRAAVVGVAAGSVLGALFGGSFW